MNRKTGDFVGMTTMGETVHAFVPYPLPPMMPELLSESYQALNRLAELSLARLNGVSGLVPSVDWLLYGAIRKEALLTSQIEGTQATLQDLFDNEAGFEVNNAQDVEEVTNYLQAFYHVREQLSNPNGLPISVRLICEAHRCLLNGVRGASKQPGELRRSQNWIGGSRPGNAMFVPPPAEEVPRLLSELEHFIHQSSTLPPLVRIGLIHVQFETIHPFLDGNGRMGRLLIAALLEDWQLLQAPLLYLSGYLKRHQATYYRLLSGVRSEGDWEAWISFFLQGVIEAADEAEQNILKLATLVNQDRQRLLSNSKTLNLAYRLFELLPTMPRFSVEQVRQVFDSSYPTANSAVKTLMSLGIVKETTGQQKNRSFSYQKYIDLLAQ